MKIAMLSTFYPFRGGIAQFSACMYRELEKEHEVRAFTFTRQYPDVLFPGKTQFVTESDNADPVDADRILDTVNPFSYAKTAKAIKAFAPDLLLLRLWMPFFAPSLGYVAASVRKTGTKVITVLDNVIPHEQRPGDALLIRYFLKRSDGFIAMSRPVESDLLVAHKQARYAFKPHPIYGHFAPSIDTNVARQKLDIPEDKKVILFFGFIRKYKGLDTVIRAMAHLSDDYLLLVAGEVYGDFAEYQVVIDETGTADKIKLCIEYIDDDDVKIYFSAANVGVLPYKSATQSGIAQIAYAFNLPQIATNVGGLADMVEDGVTGLVLDSQDPAKLAERIRYYFDKELQKPYSSALADRQEDFSWPGFTDTVLKLYQELDAG